MNIKNLVVERGLMETERREMTIRMDTPQPSFWSILYRTVVTHTVTYFATGVTVAMLLDYSTRIIRPDVAPIIRKMTDPILMQCCCRSLLC